MTIQVDNALPPNVVEIGNEITQGVVDGLMSASPSPSSANPYLTVNKAATTYLPLAGGALNIDSNISVSSTPDVDNYFTTSIFSASGLTITSASQNGYTRFYDTYISGTGFGGESNNNFYLSTGSVSGSAYETSKWQLSSTDVSGYTYDNGYNLIWSLGNSGITFPDSTVQTTAATAPTFATEAQSVAGTSTTVVSNPSTNQALVLHSEWYVLNAGNATSVASGTGGAVAQEFGFQIFTGTTSGSYGIRKFSPSAQVGVARGRDAGIWDYSKQIVLTGTSLYSNAQTNTNSRVSLGKVTGDNNGDLARTGIGWKRTGTGALQLMVHNGTSLTISTNGTFTPTASQGFDWKIIANGAGNATLYVNESSVATTTGCPTGQSTNTANFLQYELDCSATLGSQTIFTVGNPKILQGR